LCKITMKPRPDWYRRRPDARNAAA